MSLFNTLCRGLLVGIKKEPAFQLVPLYLRWVEKKNPTNVEFFYTLKKVEKKPNLTVELFIPPSGFEPLLRE